MKKLNFTLTVFLILTFITASAQDFSIFGGLNISMIQEKDDGGIYSDEYKNLLGLNAGFKAAFETNGNNYLETGLFLSNKGFKMEVEEVIEGIAVKAEGTISLYYLEVPLNAKTTVNVDKNIDLYFTYGLFLGVGVSGKIKVKASAMGETDTETIDIEWGSDPEEDYFKQFDLGLGFGAGVEFSSVIIGFNYSYGLLNISPYSDGGYRNKSRAFSIMLGYKFPKKQAAQATDTKLYQ
jgi:hypothetical protein